MPTAIAGFLITTLGATGFAATLITAVVTIGFTVGTGLLVNAIFGPGRPKPSDGQQETREAIGSRYRSYGIVHSSGQITFLESRDGTLAKVITLDTCKTSEILQHRINDNPVTVAGGTVTDAHFHGALHIYTREGDPDQTAIGELTAKFAEWTADHRQRGCSHVALICDPVKQKLFSEVYNNRIPEYSQVRKGAPVYDPRLDDTAVIGFDLAGAPIMGAGPQRVADETTWGWNDNGPLVTANYWAHADGYGGGYDNVNWTNIAQEADHADEEVITVGAETIARWRIWARYALATEERRAVLTSMLQAIDGFCWQDAEAKFNLICGRWVEPTVVITDDHILSMTATLGPDAQKRVSAIKMLYTEAAIGYREQESNTIAVPAAEADPNTDPQAVQAYYIPHHNQAMRVGKLLANQLGEERWHQTLMLNLFGLNLIGERFCRVESAQLGVSAYFKVGGLKLHLAAEPPIVEVRSLDEVKPEDWTFDAATEEGTPPGGSEAPPPDVTVPVPTGLEVSAVQILLGQSNGVAIEAAWDDPGRPDLSFEVQYRPSAGGAWLQMAVDSEARTARSGPVDSGTEYEVQVRAVTLGGRASDWSASVTLVPTATVTLSPPTGLSAVGSAGAADVSFSMPTSPNLAYARLYHNTANDFGSATQVGGNIAAGPGVGVTINDSGLAAGTEYYWARAFDGVGGQSTVAGPATATIS